MKALTVTAIGLGIALLAGSLVWAFLFPAAKSWTVEKNNRMSELSIKAHKLGGELDAAQRRPSMHSRGAAEIEAEYKQVTEELTQLRGEFESKRDAPKKSARLLQWVGIVCVAIGAFASYASKG